MSETELLMHLAEIAGIFVGFGALIAIRSDAPRDEEVTVIRQIVILGIAVVAAAVFPVMLAGFGIGGHALWGASAGVFLVLFWGSNILNRWDVERTRYLAEITSTARMRFEIPLVPLWGFMNIALVLILTGRFPVRESALYVASVAAALFLTAATLLILVYLQRRSGPDERVAVGSEADVVAQDTERRPPSETRDRRPIEDPR